jgi:hypothetical protein
MIGLSKGFYIMYGNHTHLCFNTQDSEQVTEQKNLFFPENS